MSPEKKILCCLVAGLLGLEGVVRLAEPRLSADLAHVGTFSGLAETLGAGAGEPEGSGLRVLVVGNSLARCGIDEAGLEDALGAGGERPVVVASMTPDATGIAEWTWGFRRYVGLRGARPDLVILVTGRTHLADPARFQLARLGAFYVDPADRREFVTREVTGFEDRVDFLLAGVSRLWSDRARVRPLLFYRAVPGYEESANRVNRALGGGLAPALPGTVAGEAETDGKETRLLRRFVASVRATGARLVVVTAPLPEPWDLPEAVSAALGSEGVTVLPLGRELRLPEERFPDGYHLDDEGARLVTGRVLERLPAGR